MPDITGILSHWPDHSDVERDQVNMPDRTRLLSHWPDHSDVARDQVLQLQPTSRQLP